MTVCLCHCKSERNFETLGLNKIQEFIDKGRLKVKPNELITMRDLWLAGLVTQVGDGLKLLAGVLSSC